MTRVRSSVAPHLWRAAIGALAILPTGIAIAHRSSPVFLIAAALLSIAAASVEGTLLSLVRRLRVALASPLGMALAGAFCWSALSVTWSGFPLLSLRWLGEFWLPVLAGAILLMALPSRLGRGAFLALALGLAAAGLIILVDLSTGLAMRRSLGVRADDFIHNRPSLTLLFGYVPLLVAAGLSRRAPDLAIAVLVGLLAAAAVGMSQSGAARLAALILIATFLAARISMLATARLGAAALILAILLAPLAGTIADRIIPEALHHRLADTNSRARVDIWLSFGAAVAEQPWLGAGFGTSPRMREMPVADEVPPERRLLLAAGHPHNAALQIWAELGLPGAFAAVAVALLLVRAIARRRGMLASAELAFLAAVASVSMTAHGAWQGWWAASIAAAIVWLRGTERFAKETSR
jgi:O-antigen ligase